MKVLELLKVLSLHRFVYLENLGCVVPVYLVLLFAFNIVIEMPLLPGGALLFMISGIIRISITELIHNF